MSKYFKWAEFACPCCQKTIIDTELLTLLDQIREDFGDPIKVTSGYRCPDHNKKVGGVPNSTHQKGQGADIAPLNNDVDDLDRLLKSCQKLSWNIGNGINKGFLHVDIRSPKLNEKGVKIKREWYY